jgi:hypothetical protein
MSAAESLQPRPSIRKLGGIDESLKYNGDHKNSTDTYDLWADGF